MLKGGLSCRDVAHARSLLTALFQTTCKLNDEVQRTKAEITDLEERYEIEKGTAEAAKEESEERRAELEEARAAANAAETSAEEASRVVAETEAARKQVWPLLREYPSFYRVCCCMMQYEITVRYGRVLL